MNADTMPFEKKINSGVMISTPGHARTDFKCDADSIRARRRADSKSYDKYTRKMQETILSFEVLG